MSRKLPVVLMSVAIASFGMIAVGSAAQASSGVPDRFAPCLAGGYHTLVRSNATSFANLGACVSYAVRGGTLYRELDVNSLYTPLRGAGGPPGPPDANGDSTGGSFDGGVITGTFSYPGPCIPQFPNTECFNFGMQLTYVLHTSTGVANGTGPASCDPCSVAGRTGTISFATTVVGHAVQVDDLVFVAYDGGTWQITGASGDLAGLSGSGSWTQEVDGTRTFSGSILSPA